VHQPADGSAATHDLLARIALFAELPEPSLRVLAQKAASVHLQAGSTLMREGGPGDALYALVSGRLRVFAEQPDGSRAAVGEVSAGEVVGEMALLSDEPHAATVKAIRDSHLLEIAREDFETLGREAPTVAMAIARLMVARLRRSIHHTSEVGRVRSLALVGTDRDSLDGFAARLGDALETTATVALLSGRRVEAALGGDHAGASPGSAADLELVAWLNRQEATHDIVVYVTDPGMGPWTQRCLRQADRVLVVGWAASSPTRKRSKRPCEQPARIRPPGSIWWSSIRPELLLPAGLPAG